MAASLISSATAPPSTSGSQFTKSSFFGNEITGLFSFPSSPRCRSRSLHIARRFKSLSARASLDHIPKQFREENLKEGLLDNYKNAGQCLYGLSPSQMNMFITEESVVRRQSERVTEESISAMSSYRDHGGMYSLVGNGTERLPKYSMSMGANMYYSGGGVGGRPRNAPPDLPSLILDARIVFIGMPLFPAVTELIIAQLMWLDFDDSTKPIYLNINCTGTQNEELQAVGDETNAYAIADCMALCKSRVYTLNMGTAHGQAAMLLALGEKGFRALIPSSSTKLHLPTVHGSSGSATDMWIQGKELEANADVYLELLSKGIGKPAEEINKDIQHGKYFSAQEAIAYGIADKIVTTEDMPYEARDYDKLLAQSKAARVASRQRAGSAPSGF